MARHSRLRPGTTMIETLVALALFVALFGMWRVLAQAPLKYPTIDIQLQTVMAFEANLQQAVTPETQVSVWDNKLLLTRGETVFIVEFYEKSGDPDHMIRMHSRDDGGHEPMLHRVAEVKWTAHSGYVSYSLLMQGREGYRYEGVVLDGSQTG